MISTKSTLDSALQQSLSYLESDAALASLKANAYWPKWNSPWWHMTLLREMGLADRIPKRAVDALSTRLQESPVKIFPIHPADVPEGVDLFLDTHCHCALGNVFQALGASGVALDRDLPWIRPWFLRYQVADGGLNCDGDAYLKDPVPSSMVGTVSPVEAILFHTNRPFTPEEERFLDRGARCLLERELRLATSNPHNAEEREDEEDWLKLCFPRFYLYDVLRGLRVVLHWSDRRKQPIPQARIKTVYESLKSRFPDGQIRIERQAYEGVKSRSQNASSEWSRGPATFFPLLEHVSQVGSISPYLSAEWAECQKLHADLTRRGLIV